MKPAQLRRTVLAASLSVIPVLAMMTPGAAAARPASGHIKILRTVTFSGKPPQLQDGALADAKRGFFYLRRAGRLTAVNTVTGRHTGVAHATVDEGMLLNRTSGDLYTFNQGNENPDEHGLAIVRGTQVVSQVGVDVIAGINLGTSSLTDLINQPEDPFKQSYLLEYDGTRLIGRAPVCNGLSVQAGGGDDVLGYNPKTGLLYIACGEWLPKYKHSRIEVFHGTKLVATISNALDADYVRVDPAHNLTYVVGLRRVEVIRGTHVVGKVRLTITGKYFPGLGNSGMTSDGTVYIGTFGKGGAVTVLRGTTVLGRVSTPADELVVNQRTGVVYAERKTSSSPDIELIKGATIVGHLSTDGILAGWDSATGDEIASSAEGLVAIHGRHVAQTIPVGPSPHDIISDPSGSRLYALSSLTLTIMST